MTSLGLIFVSIIISLALYGWRVQSYALALVFGIPCFLLALACFLQLAMLVPIGIVVFLLLFMLFYVAMA